MILTSLTNVPSHSALVQPGFSRIWQGTQCSPEQSVSCLPYGSTLLSSPLPPKKPHGSKGLEEGIPEFRCWAALPASHSALTPAPFLPEEGSEWVGSLSYCLVAETKLDRLNVKTRTFVLEIIHEVLMPGIQNPQ